MPTSRAQSPGVLNLICAAVGRANFSRCPKVVFHKDFGCFHRVYLPANLPLPNRGSSNGEQTRLGVYLGEVGELPSASASRKRWPPGCFHRVYLPANLPLP